MKRSNAESRRIAGRRRRIWIVPALVGAALGFLSAAGFLSGALETLSAAATDRFFLPRAPDPSIIVVAIDDTSLAKIGRWPWPRSVHAELVTRLKNAGAKVIALDVNFPEASSEDEDRRLTESLRSAGNVILPVELNITRSRGRLVFDVAKVVQPIAAIQSAALTSGFSNVPLDGDGTARRLPLAVTAPDEGSPVFAFAYEAARLSGRAPRYGEVPQDSLGQMVINFPGAPRRSFTTISAADILQKTTDLSLVKNAVIFVGATARDLHDEQYVPTSDGVPMSGIEIHASAYDTLVRRAWLSSLNPWIQALALVVSGLLLGLAVPRLRARFGLLLVVVLLFGWLVFSFFAFDRGYIVNIVWPILLLILAYLSLLLERWVYTEAERRKLKIAFSRYLSSNVVDELLRDLDTLKLGGERRNMSVLFSDLRGFTTLSEGLSPEKLVEILNKYLDEMTNVVFEGGGTLDKYIGDAVMAFWNAPLDQNDHASRAVAAAVKMRDRLAQMNKSRVFPDGITLKLGVGVNTGDVVVGNIGGERRYDYTVIGDSVNLASRSEGLCKQYGVEIVITENTQSALAPEFVTRLLDKVAVKGKKEPIKVFEVMGFSGKIGEKERELKDAYEAALAAYFSRRFDEAASECEKILTRHSDDLATSNLLERSRAYQKNPPPENWDGTWVMTKK